LGRLLSIQKSFTYYSSQLGGRKVVYFKSLREGIRGKVKGGITRVRIVFRKKKTLVLLKEGHRSVITGGLQDDFRKGERVELVPKKPREREGAMSNYFHLLERKVLCYRRGNEIHKKEKAAGENLKNTLAENDFKRRRPSEYFEKIEPQNVGEV